MSTSSKQQRIYLQASSENGGTLLIGLQDPHDNNNSEMCVLTTSENGEVHQAGHNMYILEEGQEFHGNQTLITDVGRKGSMGEELTSLAWLQDTNLLRDINFSTVASSGEMKHKIEEAKPKSLNLELDESDCSGSWDEGSNNSSDPPVVSPKAMINNYNNTKAGLGPSAGTNSKPPHSFSSLIFLAIESSSSKALPVRDIYAWITQHFPYYRQAPVGWKNSVRHNLSLNKCFYKVECGLNMSKGSYWMVDPVHRPQLIQSLCKVSYIKADLIHQLMKDCGLPKGAPQNNPNKQVLAVVTPIKTVTSTTTSPPPPSTCSSSLSSNSSNILSRSTTNNLPDPKLFPFLSRRLAYGGLGNNPTDNPDVDAATAMLALGEAPVDRSSPTDDHTYSFSSPRPVLPANKNVNNKRPLNQEIAQQVPDMVRELEVCTYILPDRESMTLKSAKMAKTRGGGKSKMTAKQ